MNTAQSLKAILVSSIILSGQSAFAYPPGSGALGSRVGDLAMLGLSAAAALQQFPIVPNLQPPAPPEALVEVVVHPAPVLPEPQHEAAAANVPVVHYAAAEDLGEQLSDFEALQEALRLQREADAFIGHGDTGPEAEAAANAHQRAAHAFLALQHYDLAGPYYERAGRAYRRAHNVPAAAEAFGNAGGAFELNEDPVAAAEAFGNAGGAFEVDGNPVAAAEALAQFLEYDRQQAEGNGVNPNSAIAEARHHETVQCLARTFRVMILTTIGLTALGIGAVCYVVIGKK